MKGRWLFRSLADGAVQGLALSVSIYLSFTHWGLAHGKDLLWITISLAIAGSCVFFLLCFWEERIRKNLLISILGPVFGFLCFYLFYVLLLRLSQSGIGFFPALRPSTGHGDTLFCCLFGYCFIQITAVLRLLILIGLSVKILLHRRKMENMTSFSTE